MHLAITISVNVKECSLYIPTLDLKLMFCKCDHVLTLFLKIYSQLYLTLFCVVAVQIGLNVTFAENHEELSQRNTVHQ